MPARKALQYYMSYCVNCGVELHESEKKCPLCDTVVLNPAAAFDDNAKPVFPKLGENAGGDGSENRRLTALIISIVIAIPVSVCLITNYGISKTLTWSLLVLAIMSLLWLFVTPFFLMKKPKVTNILLIDLAAVLLFLFILYKYDNAQRNWFVTLAVPVTLSAFTMICILAASIRSNSFSSLTTAAVFFLSLGAFIVALEVITDLYISGGVSLLWSLIVLAPCALLALLCIILKRKKQLKDELKRRFYI